MRAHTYCVASARAWNSNATLPNIYIVKGGKDGEGGKCGKGGKGGKDGAVRVVSR